ncbi:MAG: RNA-binding S4 domain-containing protein [Alphaproteobacteria bacterium]|jgi:ribosome-associated heat shock protein Hsp15|nr:RNA-binding S4 domain-containing protein [Alphaproteobacteria bacterium]|tara:strand:+ start:499 stop:888 length:390 start_codon:yes stop_codon:yes gene_type:complete
MPSAESLRLDKWLWYARFLKSRTLASRLCADSRVRINRRVVGKAHAPVRVGDVLTFPQGAHIRVVRIAALGTRRGPATEAASLYVDLAPPHETRADPASAPIAARSTGAGRPTKADRRALDRLHGGDRS